METAYLVMRTGDQWRDVVKLIPSTVTTIGRADSNRIVVEDEVCSRHHCEVFYTNGNWFIRDLQSRTGTLLNGRRLTGDAELTPGMLIQIGSCRLNFTLELAKSLPASELGSFSAAKTSGGKEDTAHGFTLETDSSELGPEILQKKGRSRYRSPETGMRDRASRELSRLFQLALEMGASRSVREVCSVVLKNVINSTAADQGAILLFPKPHEGAGSDEETKELFGELTLTVSRSESQVPYQELSHDLAELVLNGREAVLGRNVDDDSHMATRDNLGQIRATSIICAPIHIESTIYGLIHLNSTDPENEVGADDLEFTLAVADQTAVVLEQQLARESLEVGLARVQIENESLRKQLQIENELLGNSRVMNQLRQDILRAAPTDATVLIRGESGVGKELVARAIHLASGRHEYPHICMNCAALSESLLESELFGHEKGAFTGADDRSIGKFEQANHGTLFMDEVGEMNPAIQAKFLRVLEGHAFERLGGREQIKVDTRVIAATNRDLVEFVKQGGFRQDLYYRLHVIEIVVPPLRERRSDVPVLAHHFLQRTSKKIGRESTRFSREALEMLLSYDWPGNVRELQNVVERTAIMAAGDEIQSGEIHLTSTFAEPVNVKVPTPIPGFYTAASLEQVERDHIIATLTQTQWNKSQAAQILGIERSTLDRKLKKYGVKRPGQ